MMDTMDIEAIIEANPDLIIMAPRQEKMYDELKEIAPVVMLEDYSNDWEANLKQVATLFDKEDEAQAWLDDYYAEAKKIGDEIKKAKGDQSYVVALASSGQFMIFSEGGMGTILKDDMGLKQPANMPWFLKFYFQWLLPVICNWWHTLSPSIPDNSAYSICLQKLFFYLILFDLIPSFP